jgi:hypothetical protein
MRRTIAVLVSSLVLSATVALAADQPIPTEKGTYIQDSNSWNKMYLASVIGVKNGGVAASAFTYGIAKAHVEVIYRDAEAPVKTSNAKPTFRVVGDLDVAPRDIIIVRVEKKKDHRELQTAKAGLWSGINSQYPREAITEVSVQQVDGGVVITPNSDLKPGEYLLFAGQPFAGGGMPSGYGGFDFSVKK